MPSPARKEHQRECELSSMHRLQQGDEKKEFGGILPVFGKDEIYRNGMGGGGHRDEKGTESQTRKGSFGGAGGRATLRRDQRGEKVGGATGRGQDPYGGTWSKSHNAPPAIRR